MNLPLATCPGCRRGLCCDGCGRPATLGGGKVNCEPCGDSLECCPDCGLSLDGIYPLNDPQAPAAYPKAARVKRTWKTAGGLFRVLQGADGVTVAQVAEIRIGRDRSWRPYALVGGKVLALPEEPSCGAAKAAAEQALEHGVV